MVVFSYQPAKKDDAKAMEEKLNTGLAAKCALLSTFMTPAQERSSTTYWCDNVGLLTVTRKTGIDGGVTVEAARD